MRNVEALGSFLSHVGVVLGLFRRIRGSFWNRFGGCGVIRGGFAQFGVVLPRFLVQGSHSPPPVLRELPALRRDVEELQEAMGAAQRNAVLLGEGFGVVWGEIGSL